MAIKIARPGRRIPITTNLGVYGEWMEADAELRAALAKDSPNVPELTRGVLELQEQMEESTVELHLEALDRTRWKRAVAANPPREGDPEDANNGVNTDTFFNEVIPLSITKVTYKTTGGVADFNWSDVEDDLTDAQWQAVAAAVLRLNRVVTSAPLSRAASRETRGSSES